MAEQHILVFYDVFIDYGYKLSDDVEFLKRFMDELRHNWYSQIYLGPLSSYTGSLDDVTKF